MFRLMILCSLLVIFTLSTSSQSKAPIIPTVTPMPDLPPGNISLLPDYVHVKKRGIDTAIGEISKSKGLTIQYDNGFLAGNYAWGRYGGLGERLAWYKEQQLSNISRMPSQPFS